MWHTCLLHACPREDTPLLLYLPQFGLDVMATAYVHHTLCIGGVSNGHRTVRMYICTYRAIIPYSHMGVCAPHSVKHVDPPWLSRKGVWEIFNGGQNHRHTCYRLVQLHACLCGLTWADFSLLLHFISDLLFLNSPFSASFSRQKLIQNLNTRNHEWNYTQISTLQTRMHSTCLFACCGELWWSRPVTYHFMILPECFSFKPKLSSLLIHCIYSLCTLSLLLWLHSRGLHEDNNATFWPQHQLIHNTSLQCTHVGRVYYTSRRACLVCISYSASIYIYSL